MAPGKTGRSLAGAPLNCPQRGADMPIIAFVTEASPVQRIILHIGEPAELSLIPPASRPPMWLDALDSLPDWDAMAQPEPEYVFVQKVQTSRVASRIAPWRGA